MTNDDHGERMNETLKRKGWLVSGLAVGCLIAAAVLVLRGPPPGFYLSQAPLIAALGLAALILGWIARALFRQDRRQRAGEAPPAVDFSHGYRLMGVFAVLLVIGAAARQLLVPYGFGKFGHYRPEAIAKARAFPVRHRGEEACKKCHAKNYGLHAKGMHKPVQCEVCHGPGQAHAATGDKRLITKRKVACLVCHQKLRARPETFPQIDLATHFLNKGMGKRGADCWICHNPHQPLFIDQEAATARVHHPVSHQCRDCHAHMPAATPKPRRHPVVFDCNYCHPDKAKAVAERPHRDLGCRTCHKFSRTAKYYGYIIRFMVKNRDRRFCLMCHEKIKGRTGPKPPTIVWKTHLKDMAGDLNASCVDCHQNKIHPVKKRAAATPAEAPTAPPADMGAPAPAPAPAPSGAAAPASRPAPAPGARAATAMAPMTLGGPPRPAPRRRPPRIPASHRGNAEHKTCNRACHAGLLPASHKARSGGSCRGCHR